ncbi:hypothetical protein [Laspinema olomoucense]|uniref:Uncharacterized protein n=1 Tax=Laspinema olomoucense D3b TaxID=2953688 RepID=A0ABT2N2K7_9CYAN|nr:MULTISPECIES: hypothetical protein [unclassified Laspinema]MCT7970577.1 hypothetical protein [Laspinema sp. D3d]MCT7976928.1 hypothetical protein [Laspinema sp. D3b]MCT7989564.1 hypothetical protein [Laspinema sp. D3a]MCT7996835.1 hypothetical protein [Laspinema sp. D3c]
MRSGERYLGALLGCSGGRSRLVYPGETEAIALRSAGWGKTREENVDFTGSKKLCNWI